MGQVDKLFVVRKIIYAKEGFENEEFLTKGQSFEEKPTLTVHVAEVFRTLEGQKFPNQQIEERTTFFETV